MRIIKKPVRIITKPWQIIIDICNSPIHSLLLPQGNKDSNLTVNFVMIKVNKSIWLIVLAIMLITSCEFEVTTAHIENITICTVLDGDICESNNPIISPSDPNIYISCKLENAPQNTLVTFIWRYNDGENSIVIDKITLNSSDIGVNVDLSSRLSRPYNGWPIGKYEIEISVDDKNNAPIIKYFEVR